MTAKEMEHSTLQKALHVLFLLAWNNTAEVFHQNGSIHYFHNHLGNILILKLHKGIAVATSKSFYFWTVWILE